MPYILQYVEAPKDMGIAVLPGEADQPPEGYELQKFSLRDCPEAFLIVPWEDTEKMKAMVEEFAGTPRPYSYYHCSRCQGWIEGFPNQYHVDTLAPHLLAGRRGEEYYCRRCGTRIGFFGMVS